MYIVNVTYVLVQTDDPIFLALQVTFGSGATHKSQITSYVHMYTELTE